MNHHWAILNSSIFLSLLQYCPWPLRPILVGGWTAPMKNMCQHVSTNYLLTITRENIKNVDQNHQPVVVEPPVCCLSPIIDHYLWLSMTTKKPPTSIQPSWPVLSRRHRAPYRAPSAPSIPSPRSGIRVFRCLLYLFKDTSSSRASRGRKF